MIEKTLRTTEGKLKIAIPSELGEVTLGQMMALQEKDQLNDLDAISILSGIALTELHTVRSMHDFHVFGDAILGLSHQIKYLYNSEAIPKKVVFVFDKRKITVNVINNLSVEPAGAFMAARDIIADEINTSIKQHGEKDWQQHFQPSLNACCHLLAHYFYGKVTGKPYNEYQAEEFAETVKKLGVTEALPIAKHFFTCYPNLSKPRTSYFRRLQLHWRKKRALKRLKNLSISTP